MNPTGDYSPIILADHGFHAAAQQMHRECKRTAQQIADQIDTHARVLAAVLEEQKCRTPSA